MTRPPRKKLTDWQQIGIIWGVAAILIFVMLVYLEWETRP